MIDPQCPNRIGPKSPFISLPLGVSSPPRLMIRVYVRLA